MKLTLVLGALFFCTTTYCVAEADPNLVKVVDTVDTYIQFLTNRYSKNFDPTPGLMKKLQHNDATPGQAKWGYAEIKEPMIALVPGFYVFSRVSIVRTTKAYIWVNHFKPSTEKEDTYFVLLRFELIAKSDTPTSDGSRQLKIFQSPIQYDRYLIISKDPTDELFKPIDSYPRVTGEFDLYGIPAILVHPGVVISGSDKERLCLEFLKR